MAKTLTTLLVLLVLTPVTPAGPPEGVSGAMSFDEVCDWLRQYRREQDQAKRVQWMRKLGATRDPRVAVALMEACLDKANPTDVRLEAILSLKAYFPDRDCSVERWWKENEADLRRRAKELPR
jgi:hypothetical protein